MSNCGIDSIVLNIPLRRLFAKLKTLLETLAREEFILPLYHQE
jgi:hypothetical protein